MTTFDNTSKFNSDCPKCNATDIWTRESDDGELWYMCDHCKYSWPVDKYDTAESPKCHIKMINNSILNVRHRYKPSNDTIKSLYGEIAERLADQFIRDKLMDIIKEFYPVQTNDKGRICKLSYPIGDIVFAYDSPRFKRIICCFEVKYGNVIFPYKQQKRYIDFIKNNEKEDVSIHAFLVKCCHAGNNFKKIDYIITKIGENR